MKRSFQNAIPLIAAAALVLVTAFVAWRSIPSTAPVQTLTVITRASASPSSPPYVDINTADVDELARLDGIGRILAARIVAYREEHGPFGDKRDLLAVDGIGESKLAAVWDRIKVSVEE
ncbi:MAG: ComEA family DNA-binding protein [Acutalibacteraceae bacterium]|jgi:competence protein ComEA